jgi:hypothetical protein
VRAASAENNLHTKRVFSQWIASERPRLPCRRGLTAGLGKTPTGGLIRTRNDWCAESFSPAGCGSGDVLDNHFPDVVALAVRHRLAAPVNGGGRVIRFGVPVSLRRIIGGRRAHQAADDAIFTCDIGLPTVWAARYLAMNGKRRLLGSFWHESMANAMAQAIGAQSAFPGRQVISRSRDGGFAMLMGDFLSLAQLRLPVKVVVFNNGAVGGY